MAPELFAQSFNADAFFLGGMIGTMIAVVVCASLPLMTGASRGHVVLGIVFALLTVPAAFLFGCLGGLPVGGFFALILKVIPQPSGNNLLSRREIEAEMRRARGY